MTPLWLLLIAALLALHWEMDRQLDDWALRHEQDDMVRRAVQERPLTTGLTHDNRVNTGGSPHA